MKKKVVQQYKVTIFERYTQLFGYQGRYYPVVQQYKVTIFERYTQHTAAAEEGFPSCSIVQSYNF